MTGSGGEIALSPEQRRAVETDCSRLVTSFAHFVDSRRYPQLVALFADDGSFSRPGIVAAGSEAIASLMEGRPTNVVTRHICGATLFENIDADRASAITYVTIYQAEGEDGVPAEIDRLAGVAEYHDEFRRTPEGWRIASRVARPVFIGKK